jgi:hypothetical protein
MGDESQIVQGISVPGVRSQDLLVELPSLTQPPGPVVLQCLAEGALDAKLCHGRRNYITAIGFSSNSGGHGSRGQPGINGKRSQFF